VIFADTSAMYALLDANDPNHPAARRTFESFQAADARLMTHAYVVVEVVALVQRRLGLDIVRRLADDLLPIIEVLPVDAGLHAEAMASLLASGRRGVSLVDHTSFLVMRRRGITQAFAFDADFAHAGFQVVPAA
jgi:predicted nucleic acid-binding protein